MFSLVFSCHFVDFLTLLSLSVFLSFHHCAEFYSSPLSSPLRLSSLIMPSSPSFCLLFVCPSFLFFSSPFYSLHYFHTHSPFRKHLFRLLSSPFSPLLFFLTSPHLSSSFSPLLFSPANQSPHYLFLRAFLPSNCTSSHNALLLHCE